jgi:hypothetical protein
MTNMFPWNKKSRGVNLENEGAREWIPLFLSDDQNTHCQVMNMMEEVRWFTIQLENCSHRDMM